VIEVELKKEELNTLKKKDLPKREKIYAKWAAANAPKEEVVEKKEEVIEKKEEIWSLSENMFLVQFHT